MSNDELLERIEHIRKAVANLQQNLGYITRECDNLRAAVLNANQETLFDEGK